VIDPPRWDFDLGMDLVDLARHVQVIFEELFGRAWCPESLASALTTATAVGLLRRVAAPEIAVGYAIYESTSRLRSANRSIRHCAAGLAKALGRTSTSPRESARVHITGDSGPTPMLEDAISHHDQAWLAARGFDRDRGDAVIVLTPVSHPHV
jgi:hypothetical protein